MSAIESRTYFDEKAAAEFLSLSVRTLQKWRYEGGGPPFVRISRRAIRYSREELKAWMDARTLESTASIPGKCAA